MAANITRLLIVDDSALVRNLLQHLLSSVPDIEIVGTASDPLEAREMIKALSPDVLTLDIEMPNMNGLEFLEKIMRLRPMPVIMISTLTQRGAVASLQALELGAFDYIPKPTSMLDKLHLAQLKVQLIAKIRAAASARLRPYQRLMRQSTLQYAPVEAGARVIAIGASTGGVEALRDLLARFPSNMPPIVITQHMPEQFTPSFARRLDSMCDIQVREAAQGDLLEPGRAYIAPGNQHLEIAAAKGNHIVCQLHEGPRVSGHRPSVDVLFNSVAQVVGADSIGVLLTGMGRDGASGLLAMCQAGAHTIGQDEASCVVYGMPRAARTIGAVREELPLDAIASHVIHHCEQRRN